MALLSPGPIAAAIAIAIVVAAILMAGATRVSEVLVRFRARRLPPGLSDRLAEEWLAELRHLDRRASALAFAFGLLLTSNKAFESPADGPPVALVPVAEYRAYSDYGERVIAFVLDQLLFVLFSLVVVFVSVVLGRPARWVPEVTRAGAVRLEFFRFFVGMCAYAVVFVYCVVRFGASPGKLLMKLRIVTVDGGTLTMRHAILRVAPWLLQHVVSSTFAVAVALSLGQAPSTLSPAQERALLAGVVPNWLATTYSLALCLFGIADIFSFFATAQRRSLRDLIAGTVVVLKAPESIALPDQLPVKSTSIFQ